MVKAFIIYITKLNYCWNIQKNKIINSVTAKVRESAYYRPFCEHNNSVPKHQLCVFFGIKSKYYSNILYYYLVYSHVVIGIHSRIQIINILIPLTRKRRANLFFHHYLRRYTYLCEYLSRTIFSKTCHVVNAGLSTYGKLDKNISV